MSTARQAALSLLELIFVKKKSLDEALESTQGYRALQGPDRALARMLASTVLRRHGQICAALDTYLKKPCPVSPYEAHLILCLGAAQLLFMRIPPHAAIHETVELCAFRNVSGMKGLVNAVLRQLSKESSAAFPPASYNFPDWIWQGLVKDYGSDEAHLIAEASLNEAPADLTVKKPQERVFWRENLAAEELPNGSLRLQNTAIDQLPGFHDGAWWVQDVAASLPVHLLGDIAGACVLDLCAAPGGKTMQLASMGAHVTALDRSSSRMQRLKENLHRTHLDDHVEIVIADALSWKPAERFDYVLMDAPCSATGTIRRHPDLLHLKTAKDLEKLTDLQSRLLARLPLFLNQGGIAIYATCSLQKSEGEAQIDAFLAENSTFFKRQPIQPQELYGLSQLITSQGDLRCLPHHLAGSGGMDGFYAARLVFHT